MLMTAKQAGEYMNLTPATIRRWARVGKVHYQPGGDKKNSVIVDSEELDKQRRVHYIVEPKTTHGRIQYLREQAGLSRTELALEIGVDAATYRRYERGHQHVPLRVLKKLAYYHKVTTDYILCMDLFDETEI